MTEKLGATGEFPGGKLTEDDEGALNLAIGGKDGKVVIDFGTPVVWIGLTPQEAAEFASLILKYAKEMARQNGEILTVNL